MNKFLVFMNANMERISKLHGAFTVVHDTLKTLLDSLNEMLGAPKLPPGAGGGALAQ